MLPLASLLRLLLFIMNSLTPIAIPCWIRDSQVPKAREVYGSSYYGPPEGNSYHGPFYASDIYGQPGNPNREAISP